MCLRIFYIKNTDAQKCIYINSLIFKRFSKLKGLKYLLSKIKYLLFKFIVAVILINDQKMYVKKNNCFKNKMIVYLIKHKNKLSEKL